MSRDILYPLRRLHGCLYEWNTKRLNRNAYLTYVTTPKGKKAFILGTPAHTNLGDSAIVVAQMRYLERCGFEKDQIKDISVTDYSRYPDVVDTAIQKQKHVFWHGGGNMGDIWPHEEQFRQEVLKKNPNLHVLIFPQTIDYRKQDEDNILLTGSFAIYNNRKNITLVAREEKSWNTMQRVYPNAQILLTPDIVLSMTAADFEVKPQNRQGILLCMRSDIERSMTDNDRKTVENAVSLQNIPYHYTDMYSDCPITKENRAECVLKKMQEFAGAKLVITDRLHGMVFAAITGTPCIVFSNYNHKVRGTYEWIKYLSYIRYAESSTDVEKYLPELLAMENCEYDNTPLLPYFEKLSEVVKKYAAD